MKVNLIAHTQLSEEFRKQFDYGEHTFPDGYENNELNDMSVTDGQAVSLTSIRTCYSANKPSEIVARAAIKSKPVDMTCRGIDSLTVMSDRDVVERASKTKNGEKFTKLYNGESVLENEEKDERSLMSRLAMFCSGDKERLLRLFKSSGQFRDEKPDAVYERMAKDSIQFIDRIKSKSDISGKNEGKNLNFGLNSKT